MTYRALSGMAGAITLAAVTAAGGWAGQNVPKGEIAKLGPDLSVVRIAGVAATILRGPDGVLVVDPGYEQAADRLREAIDGLGGGAIRTIIDTHWHFDHAGGNKIFGRGAGIIASGPTRRWLSEGQSLLGQAQPAYPEFARPNAVFDDAGSVSGYPEEIEIRVFGGGHTGGDLVVLFRKTGVLALGDIVFADQFPFIDIDHGGSTVALAEVIRKIIDLYPADVKIVPGHGRDLTIEDLRAYRKMVLDTTEAVRRERAGGRTLKEIQDADVLRDWTRWEGGFKKADWIEYVFRSLEKRVG